MINIYTYSCFPHIHIHAFHKLHVLERAGSRKQKDCKLYCYLNRKATESLHKALIKVMGRVSYQTSYETVINDDES